MLRNKALNLESRTAARHDQVEGSGPCCSVSSFKVTRFQGVDSGNLCFFCVGSGLKVV